MYQSSTPEKGFALLLSVIVSSIVLAIGIAILQVSVNQINLASTARESEIAFQAASAGVDCMWYHRNELASDYTVALSAPADRLPAINCYDQSQVPDDVEQDVYSGAGVRNNFKYEFDLGSPAHCVRLDMHVINAYQGDVTVNFPGNEGVGNNGTKTCSQNRICTVLFATGHNRDCANVGTSIFSVQRELTVEF